MLLNIPFYQNKGDGNQCMQVAMQSVLKYFLNKEYSLEELDKLTGRKNMFWTWISQIVPVLNDLGLKVIYYADINLEPFLEGEKYIEKHYGKDAHKILRYSDVPVIIKAIKKLLAPSISLFEKKKVKLEEIESEIKKGHVPLMLIDDNKIKSRQGRYQGHFVVVSGFDKENIYYHESGPETPEQHKKVSKELFLQAWNANGTDNAVVIVSGKR